MLKVETVVFLSLVLDLFAFTIPLPLFPKLIQWYTNREISDPNGFLSQTLRFVSAIRGLLYKPSVHSQKWDVVLLGGLMGSVFSMLQFIVSPRIGSLSDKYGRKRVLLITMIGNILSALVWIKSTTFASYMLSRVIGGLSEGNVQLAIAILSDVTSPENRSKALAHVGIAFAICFCIGPPIGAYFASKPLPASTTFGLELNVYAVPAIITLILLTVETLFLVVALPETRGKGIKINPQKSQDKSAGGALKVSKTQSIEQRLQTLRSLRTLHLLFLGIFSGVEFTLTFLTFDLFDWNNKQNGMLIGSIGIISALLQGGYVRRATSKIGEGLMAQRGVSSCFLALVFLAILPVYANTNLSIAYRLLQLGAVCMAFTSATVVNSLTAYASLQCEEGGFDTTTGKPAKVHPQLAKGKALGEFRSSGQLGRAVGPLIACASYWTVGPTYTYATGAVAMLALSIHMRKIAQKRA
ncbi:MFS DHA1 sub-family [Rhodocollybia butyracea]|uniref:MFS DHA1 sub-family n=1 Tax=Rhodocollybia butyracea TaxID=206335 RepID=A0A9P5Q9J5_9AGAR|nr:MFS DHA1 sub-family [Rhodocollybia butyracea]